MKVSMQERGKGWINRKEGQSEKKQERPFKAEFDKIINLQINLVERKLSKISRRS